MNKYTISETSNVVESKGMWYAERLSDNKEFLATSMTRRGDINGIADDGETSRLLVGTYIFYQKGVK